VYGTKRIYGISVSKIEDDARWDPFSGTIRFPKGYAKI
jgi:hypothetical protein